MLEVIQVEEFLRSGSFGNSGKVYFGMNRSQLTKLFGETEYVFQSSSNPKYPTIYKYGHVEFYFEEGNYGRLKGIQIKPATNKAPNNLLEINYGFIKPKLEYERAIELLQANSIQYKLFDFEDDDKDDPKRILTQGKVILVFDSEFEIEKVYKFPDLKPIKAKTKQIHAQVEEPTYDLLRELALQKGISINELCGNIIQEYIRK